MNTKSRREFLGKMALGAGGLALLANPISTKANPDHSLMNIENLSIKGLDQMGTEADAALKKLGKKAHPLAYDMSSVNPWGLIWSNVYYLTNEQTNTPPKDLGVACVCRHHGMIFCLNDETIQKYNLGEFFGFNDPITQSPAVANPYNVPKDGVFPLPGLAGVKGLMENGCQFFVCDMARQVYAQFVAQKAGLKTEDVYADFVAGTLPGVTPAPSGVWALGRLAENGIAYIDASVG